MIDPIVRAHLWFAMRMVGIPALAVPARGFATDQERRILATIIHDYVGDAGAGFPSDKVAFRHRKDMTVKPAIDAAGNDIDELLLVSLGVRIGGATSWLEDFDVNADARK